MIYKLKTMGGQEIKIESDEALRAFLAEANSGKKLVLTKYGIVNVSSVDSIVPHRDLNDAVYERLRMRTMKDGKQVPQYTLAEAERDVLGQSPFEKIVGEIPKSLSSDPQKKLN